MLRPVAMILAAMKLCQPALDDDRAELIAHTLQREAQEHDFDPLTGVSIIFHESGFEPKVISQNKEDYGLAQIRARYIGACKGTKDPIRNPTAQCRREQERLLDPQYNIQVMADLISQNRQFCKSKTGSASFPRWLASYQGRNYPKKRQWCKPGDGTWKVINHRNYLLRELSKTAKR